MKHLGDITKISGYDAPVVDVIFGGSPCQDLSVAGKRAGLAGERSGRYMEQIRIVKEMREKDALSGRTGQFIRPRFMVWENVPGAFSSNKGQDFAAVIEEIIKVCEPDADVRLCVQGGWTKSGCYYSDDGRWSIAWRVHDAQFWGVPQRRKRIVLVADFGGLAAPEVLFERKGLSWNHKQSGETGKSPSGRAEGSLGKSISFQERSGALSAMNNQSVFSIAGNTIGRKGRKRRQRRGAQMGGHPPLVLVYDARGNGGGTTCPTLTGDHQNRVTDYTALVVEVKREEGVQRKPSK